MKQMHVYSHTHWDDEWYFTSSESLVQLVYHMDEVITALENGILKNYLLDSQVSILEEYLQVMPEKKETVKKLVSEGKLMVGPWYTQTDELIISGECIARNLLYGIQSAKSLGKCMMIGYLPDSFGQSKDMPKLYNQFDIHRAIFWRGVPRDVCNRREFYWNSEDGSRVLCYNIKDGYFYGGNLIYTDDVEKVESRILSGAKTTNQLLPLGGDQRYVDFNLKERLQYYNERSMNDIHYFESNLESFFDELQKEKGIPELRGEFIDASDSKIHHSIYSTRYDHKQLNDQIERRILYQLEPFMVMQMQLGIPAKTSLLDSLWKKLLLNHAHDSACGCNSDQTNDSILQRLRDCDQTSKMMLDYQVRKLSESFEGIKENDYILYNTLPYTKDTTCILEVITKKPGFKFLDEKNQCIDFDLLERKKEYSGSIRKDESSYKEELYYYKNKISVRIKMKPTSYRILHVEEGEFDMNVPSIMEASIENEFYKIYIENRHLNLFLKEKNKTIQDFILLEDGGDEGDTYDYSWPTTDKKYILDFKNAKTTIKKAMNLSYMIFEGCWSLPENLEKRDSGTDDVCIPYVFEIGIDHTDLIQCHLDVENKAIEHRMRMICKGLDPCSESIADTIYGTIHRDNEPKHMSDWKNIGYREEPTPIYPMLHHVTTGQSTVLTCFAKGIKEYEILENKNIALTLFRSVPLLGRPDLNRRPGIASGNEFKYIPTPKSELKQPLSFEMALTYRKSYSASNIQKDWILYANTYLAYQIQEIDRFVNTQKYFVTHPYQVAFHAIPQKSMAITNLDACTDMIYSALYPLDDEHAILRIYNTTEQSIKEQTLRIDAVSVEETNMLYDPIDTCHFKNHVLYLENLNPGEIRNYKLKLK